ncbi:hypothetical protein EB796_012232 [Bugula neritina]|uniref:RRM domain-containing protein n=1 Tax=Bugula neritina TaxID=10212 RepID=A0A7J7JSY9_BUGNE|nr:hypothetical protein EB796_012232 [Bugula neritina]
MAVYDPHFGGYRVFVGDLGHQTTRYDIEREYERYGQLIDVWVARNPPGFAFIVFKHVEECERAVRKSHGRRLCGRRVRVEYARPFDDRSEKQKDSIRSRHRSRSPRRNCKGHSSDYSAKSRSRSPKRRRRSDDRRYRHSRYDRSISNERPSSEKQRKGRTSQEKSLSKSPESADTSTNITTTSPHSSTTRNTCNSSSTLANRANTSPHSTQSATHL